MSVGGEGDHDDGRRPEVEEAAEILGRVLEREQQTGALDASAELESLAPGTRAVLADMLEDVRRIRSHRASIGAPPAAGDTIGRYKLLELLGRGSSSTVWRARDSHVGRFVAVKILHPEHGLSEATRDPPTGGHLFSFHHLFSAQSSRTAGGYQSRWTECWLMLMQSWAARAHPHEGKGLQRWPLGK